MRIAMVANWWYRRGGLGGVMLDEATWLTERGHEVVPFAAAHPDNLPAPSASYFPPFVETSNLGRGRSVPERIAVARDIMHNSRAAELFRRFIDDVQPDLVHVHGTIRQLSPAVLGVAQRARVPVVMTLHDYGLVCPQGLLFKGGRVACEPPNCVRGNPLPAVRYRCVKGSRAGSAIAAVEYGLHRSRGSYRARVALYITPSRFLLDVIARSGAVDPRRLRHLPNGLDPGGPPAPLPTSGGHILFSGRLVPEKGPRVLVEAARLVPSIPFVVAGDGPERSELSGTAPPNVSFVGHQGSNELARLREDSVAIVSPSIWYENAPLAVIEAMRAGRPVVATEPSAQAELLAAGGGLLVGQGDATELAAAITSLWNDRERAARLGSDGRASFLKSFTAERHQEGLEALYREALRMDRDRAGLN